MQPAPRPDRRQPVTDPSRRVATRPQNVAARLQTEEELTALVSAEVKRALRALAITAAAGLAAGYLLR